MTITAALLLAGLLGALAAPSAAASGDGGEFAPCVDPIDVGLVIDRSGSMSGSKLSTAKAGASDLIDSLTSADQSGLVSYARSASLDQPLTASHGATKAAVAGLSAGGITGTGYAIDLSHGDFLARGRASAQQIMILLTDGHTNTGPDPVTEAAQAKADGIEIFAIGLGGSVNEAELKSIASSPVSEHYYHPLTTADLIAVFEDITARLTRTHGGAAEGYNAWATVNVGPETAHLNKINQKLFDPGEDGAVVGYAFDSGAHLTGPSIEVAFDTAESYANGTHSVYYEAAFGYARVENLEVRYNGAPIILADVLLAESVSVATGSSAWSGDGDTRVVDLQVGSGAAMTGSVPPNTNVNLGALGHVVLNEQIGTSGPGLRSTLRVNLVHAYLDAGGGNTAEVIVSSAWSGAHCGATAVTPPADVGDWWLDLDGAVDTRPISPPVVDPCFRFGAGHHCVDDPPPEPPEDVCVETSQGAYCVGDPVDPPEDVCLETRYATYCVGDPIEPPEDVCVETGRGTWCLEGPSERPWNACLPEEIGDACLEGPQLA